jgi:lipopolysaccharide biosynthesis glycosyltransferase
MPSAFANQLHSIDLQSRVGALARREGSVHIALAFDVHYAEYAQVTVESVLDVHPRPDRLTFWLLTTPDVVRERGAVLRRQVAGRAGMHLLKAGHEVHALPRSERPELAHLTAAMYLRLFLPSMLSPAVERFLYLDADTMCVGDLSPLWDLPMSGAPVAAVRDGFAKTLSDFDGPPPGADGLDPGAPYFNSGVLLVDVARWRAMRISEQCFDYLARHRGRLRFPDQDALNIAAYGNWLRLGREWNHMKSWRLEPDSERFGSEPEARIIHFTGPWKPWKPVPEGGVRAGMRRSRYELLAQRARAAGEHQ